MCDLMDRPHDEEHVRVWIVNALTKLVAQTKVNSRSLQAD